VNLLVELSWAGGTPVVRQYSFLLDTADRKPPPVTFAPPAAGAADAAPAKPAPEAMLTPAPVAKPAPAVVQTPAPPAEPPPAAAIPEAGGTYAVQPGDSLLKIAQATRYESVSFAQMVVAIHRANEDAFIGGDMSRLKSGRTLTIPARAVAAAVNADEARQLVAALRGQPEPARAKPPAAARAAGPEDDDVVARERALAESRDRASALEQTRADLQRLIQAREKEIAELERELGAKGAGKSQSIKK
jgi:pilus assembly protein FimV